jgi:hypothetical protein
MENQEVIETLNSLSEQNRTLLEEKFTYLKNSTKNEIEKEIKEKLTSKIYFAAAAIAILSVLGLFQFDSWIEKKVEDVVSEELKQEYVNKLIDEAEELTIKGVVSLKALEAEIPRLKKKVSELQESSSNISRDTEKLLDDYKQFGALDTDEITKRIGLLNSLSDEVLEVQKIREELEYAKNQILTLQKQIDSKEICRLKIKSNLGLGTDTVIVDGIDQERGTPFTYATKIGATHTVTVQSKLSQKEKTFDLTCDYDGESVKFVIR